jgi:hypothetical protein
MGWENKRLVMVEYGTVQFVDFAHGPMDLMGENGLYLYMVEMVIKKEKKNRVNLYVKARLYAHNDDLTFLLLRKVKNIL